MKYYTFEVCRLINGSYITRPISLYAKDIGQALQRVWKLKGYVSCQYSGRQYQN